MCCDITGGVTALSECLLSSHLLLFPLSLVPFPCLFPFPFPFPFSLSVSLFLSLVPCPLSLVPCPLSLVPCPLSLVPCPLSLVPCPLSLVPCPLSLVPCPLSLVPCPLSLVPSSLLFLDWVCGPVVPLWLNFTLSWLLFRELITRIFDFTRKIDVQEIPDLSRGVALSCGLVANCTLVICWIS